MRFLREPEKSSSNLESLTLSGLGEEICEEFVGGETKTQIGQHGVQLKLTANQD